MQATAQSIASEECKGATIRDRSEVPIRINSKQAKSLNSAKAITNYSVSIGPGNSMESLCMTGGGNVILALADPLRYAFRDIRFEYPYGFEPAESPFKLAVVQSDSVVFYMQSGPVSDGLHFKYTAVVKDLQAGALLMIDPPIRSKPN